MIKYLESSLLAKNVTNLKPIIDTISSWQIIICSSFSWAAERPLNLYLFLPRNSPPFEDFERFYQCVRTKIQTKPSFFDLQLFQALLLCKKGCSVCRDLMADLSLVPSWNTAWKHLVGTLMIVTKSICMWLKPFSGF